MLHAFVRLTRWGSNDCNSRYSLGRAVDMTFNGPLKIKHRPSASLRTGERGKLTTGHGGVSHGSPERASPVWYQRFNGWPFPDLETQEHSGNKAYNAISSFPFVEYPLIDTP